MPLPKWATDLQERWREARRAWLTDLALHWDGILPEDRAELELTKGDLEYIEYVLARRKA